ncbi:MAG TPA: DUF421 domain-containing protein [Haloplasmataceae bacterium]
MLEILQIIFRVIFNYIVIYITFRIMGKRELGELGIIDLIIFFMIAEISALSIEDLDRPLLYTLIIISLLVFFQKFFSYITLKNAKLRDKIEGTPSVIIANGKVNYQEMRKQSYTFDDLMNQLRDKNIRSISEVDYAILEVGGTLSVFKKSDSKISPLPVIISGNIIKENFKYLDITEKEVLKLLEEKGYHDISKILYANYENDELYIIKFDSSE